jgi:serine/threonine-protein phosphatase 2B catalytic subunit
MQNAQAQIQKAIGQIQERGLVPEIDFTQHQLDNGYTISTQERVVKDVRPFSISLAIIERNPRFKHQL